MTKFIRNNTKKLMAVFGVLLMVVFALPTLKSGNSGGSESGNRLVGHIGDGEKVFQADLSRAGQDWEFLEHIMASPPEGGGQYVPLPYLLSEQTANRGPRVYWFKVLADQVAQHPEVYCLLLKEADRLGITMTSAEVDQEFDRQGLGIRVPGENGRVVSIGDLEQINSAVAAVARSSFSSLLRINDVMKQAESTVKVSEPRERAEVAMDAQLVRLSVVDFTAEEFLAKAPPPTDSELSQQFLKYSGFEAGHPDSSNPHGFGYRFPNRITVQYFTVPIDDIRKQVRASRDEYTWTKDAYKVYFAHPNDYLAEPTTQPSTTASSKPVASSQPSTKPFNEVRDAIVDSIVEPEVRKKVSEVTDRINGKLANDWNAYSTRNPPVPAATEPTTQMSEKYASYEYLTQLAQDVQKQTGVLPIVAQIGKFSSSKELIEAPGIGHATLNGETLFAAYAAVIPAAVMPPDNRNYPSALQLYQPSPTFHDQAGSAYVFRLTGVMPSAPPSSLDDVIDQVRQDVKTAAAYNLAKEAAAKVVAIANGDVPATEPSTESTTEPTTQPTTLPTHTLSDAKLAMAASATGRKAVQTAAFAFASPSPIEALKLDATGMAMFRSEATTLLRVAATRPATTVSLIALPAVNHVFATQLIAIEPSWKPAMRDIEFAQSANSILSQVSQGIRMQWLQFNAVVERTQWKDERPKRSEAGM